MLIKIFLLMKRYNFIIKCYIIKMFVNFCSFQDDYLALEIRGGRIVLIMDLGSGDQEIKHDSYVSDDKWHQVIVERCV